MKVLNPSLAVCMLARNCEKHLDAAFRQLDILCTRFSSVRIFIVENNSTDGTKERIAAYAQKNPNVVTDCFDDAALDALSRIERLVLLRNRALSLVKAQCSPEPDCLLVLDADVDFRTRPLVKILRSAPSDWVSLSANGRFYLKAAGLRLPVLYYDLFAYLPEACRVSALSEQEMLDNRPDLHRKLRRQHYVRCRSAFGGMTLYRYAAVRDNVYTLEENTRSDEFDYLCEHIPFTLRLSPYGSSYICRDLHLLYEPVSLNTLTVLLRRRLLQVYIRNRAKKLLRQRKKQARKPHGGSTP